MKVAVQVLLSLEVIVARVPDGVPLSRFGTVISSALEKSRTGSLKVRVTSEVSPSFIYTSVKVKVAEGAKVSTS